MHNSVSQFKTDFGIYKMKTYFTNSHALITVEHLLIIINTHRESYCTIRLPETERNSYDPTWLLL